MSFPFATSAIVRQAFLFLEREPPSSMADDSPEVLDTVIAYPRALRTVLARIDWSFASRRRSLNAAGEDPFPDPDFPYLYPLAVDEIVMIREILTPGVKWRIDAEGLRASVSAPLPVRYTAMITDETRMSDLAQDCVALRLAILLGPFWLKTQSKLAVLKDDYKEALKQAAREDARSAATVRYDDAPIIGDWVTEARQ